MASTKPHSPRDVWQPSLAYFYRDELKKGANKKKKLSRFRLTNSAKKQ